MKRTHEDVEFTNMSLPSLSLIPLQVFGPVKESVTLLTLWETASS